MKRFTYFILLTFFVAACQESTPATEQDSPASGISEADKLTAAIEKEPDNAALYAERGLIFYNSERYAEAVEDYDKALQLDSSVLDYYHGLADSYLDNAQSRPALKTLEVALQKFPKDENTQLKLGEFQTILQQYEEAKRTYRSLLEDNPYLAEGWFMRGLLMRETGDTMQAMQSFQKTVETNPDHLDGYVELGRLAADMNQPVALNFYANALEVDSTYYPALFNLAQYHHQRGNFEPAKEYYDKLTLFHTQNPDVQYNYGLLLMEEKSYSEAKERFDIAIQLDPPFAHAYYFRGMAHERMNELQKAKSDYEAAVRFKEDYEIAKQALQKLEDKLPS